jgi:hypothetical protein
LVRLCDDASGACAARESTSRSERLYTIAPIRSNEPPFSKLLTTKPIVDLLIFGTALFDLFMVASCGSDIPYRLELMIAIPKGWLGVPHDDFPEALDLVIVTVCSCSRIQNK